MVYIIIPTLNEEAIILKTLAHIQGQNGNWEIIISDGGSTDRTLELVKSIPNIKMILSPKGRALQMNEGARHAKGNILLFLHADTFLLPSAVEKVVEAMKMDKIIGGSFYLKFDIEKAPFKLYSFFSKINHLLFTYGDQAIFIRKKIFEDIKGYKDMALMEDVEIQQRLRKKGGFIKLNQPVITSSRRFIRKGAILQQLQNMLLVILYLAGTSPTFLKKFYLENSEQ